MLQQWLFGQWLSGWKICLIVSLSLVWILSNREGNNNNNNNIERFIIVKCKNEARLCIGAIWFEINFWISTQICLFTKLGRKWRRTRLQLDRADISLLCSYLWFRTTPNKSSKSKDPNPLFSFFHFKTSNYKWLKENIFMVFPQIWMCYMSGVNLQDSSRDTLTRYQV